MTETLKRVLNDILDKKGYSDYILGFLMFGFFFGWLVNIPLIQVITLSLYVAYLLIYCNDVMLMSPVLLLGIVTLPKYIYFDSIPIFLIIEIGYFLLGTIVLCVKKYIKEGVNFSFGGIGKSLLLIIILVLISSIISLLNNKTNYDIVGFSTIGILVLIYIVYLIFQIFNSNNKEYIEKVFLFLNCLLILEVVCSCIVNLKFVHDASFLLGWSNNNNIFSLAIELCIPFITLTFIKGNKNKFNLIIFIIDLLLILLCSSRGSTLTTIILVPFILYFIIKDKIKYKKIFFLSSLGVISVFSIIYLLIIGKGWSSRETLWNLTINKYSENVLFGSGIQSLFDLRNDFVKDNSVVGIMFPHNYILTILCTGGLLGLGAFIYHIYEMLKFSLKLDKAYKYSCLMFIAIGLIHGLVDNTFFSILYMIPCIIMFSMVNDNKKEVKND